MAVCKICGKETDTGAEIDSPIYGRHYICACCMMYSHHKIVDDARRIVRSNAYKKMPRKGRK